MNSTRGACFAATRDESSVGSSHLRRGDTRSGGRLRPPNLFSAHGVERKLDPVGRFGGYHRGVRIVAVADTHLYHADLAVPDGDVFVHAGDMCRGGDLDELAATAAWIGTLPHRHKLVVAGNHDWSFVHAPAEARALIAGAGAVYLEDAAIELDGVRVWGSPWQPEFNAWAFNLPRGPALAAVWARIPA